MVRHHNAGVLPFEDCWRVRQTCSASAHYQVENTGGIGQLVNDSDTGWHAGNLQANYESIGIEYADVGQTGCPYHLSRGGKYRNAWMAEAQRFYGELGAKKRVSRCRRDLVTTLPRFASHGNVQNLRDTAPKHTKTGQKHANSKSQKPTPTSKNSGKPHP
ncbi:N-acetylmuramoyl-L-alanine amidase [Corynebacterium sp. 321]|nr:N-acetylmuramoyl-L-alanine amidase [Corynebacterium sp. 321]